MTEEQRIFNSTVENEVTSLGLRGIRTLAIARQEISSSSSSSSNSNCISSGSSSSNRSSKEDNPQRIASAPQWKICGLLAFLDPPRNDTKETIENANRYGVEVKMLTGDNLLIAREMARQLGLSINIQDASTLPLLSATTGEFPWNLDDYADHILSASGFAQMYPEHKYLVIQSLRKMGYKVAMTGDGVNDGPALKRADVGFAVAGATDVARLAADIVLTKPGLSAIVIAILASRRVFTRMKAYFVYRSASSLQILLVFFLGIFFIRPSDHFQLADKDVVKYSNIGVPEYFSLPAIMILILTVLNDGAIISVGYDNLKISERPETWELPYLFFISIVLASIPTLSTLYFLFSLMNFTDGPGTNINPHNYDRYSLFNILALDNATFLRDFNLSLNYPKVVTMGFLILSTSTFLTFFSARNMEGFFFQAPRMANITTFFTFGSLILSTVLAIFWPICVMDEFVVVEGCGYEFAIVVWVYSLVVWLIQDSVKVLVITIFHSSKQGIHHQRITSSIEMKRISLSNLDIDEESGQQEERTSSHEKE